MLNANHVMLQTVNHVLLGFLSILVTLHALHVQFIMLNVKHVIQQIVNFVLQILHLTHFKQHALHVHLSMCYVLHVVQQDVLNAQQVTTFQDQHAKHVHQYSILNVLTVQDQDVRHVPMNI